MQRRTRDLRINKLLAYIQAHNPTRLQVLAALYEVDEAGKRRFQHDLKVLRFDHEIDIGMDEDGCYFVVKTQATAAVLDAVLTAEERQLFARIQKEYGPGHPYAEDVHSLLNKLVGRLTEQQQRLETVPPARYFGPRFARDYSFYRPTIGKLEGAIRQMYRVSFINARPVSRDMEGVAHLKVEPQDIGVRNGVFYLYGYNVKMGHCYDYRIDKIQDLQILGEKFAAFRRPEEIEFEYILNAELVKGGISERFNQQCVIEMLRDGRARVRAYERPFWIKQEALRNSKMTVTTPNWLRQQIAAELELMQKKYQDVD